MPGIKFFSTRRSLKEKLDVRRDVLETSKPVLKVSSRNWNRI
jgi:hypothetical protein